MLPQPSGPQRYYSHPNTALIGTSGWWRESCITGGWCALAALGIVFSRTRSRMLACVVTWWPRTIGNTGCSGNTAVACRISEPPLTCKAFILSPATSIPISERYHCYSDHIGLLYFPALV